MSLNALSQYICTMPKIDLHCHLDGSFSETFVKNTLGLSDDIDSLKVKLRAPDICSGLAEYLERFDLPISCIQTPENIKRGVYDVIKHAAGECTKYIEIRFAPTCSLNTLQGYNDIFEAAIDGCRAAQKDFGVYSSIIACAMRHHREEENIAMLDSAREFLGNGVCALDLAGDEASFPNSGFYSLFERARKLNMPFTIHSGECHSVQNVRAALEYGAKRVGHGIALIKDPDLMEECRLAGLGLELCPTSNYQTGAVSKDEEYPLKTFLDCGLLATVNTDNRTVSNTTMTKELNKICTDFGITKDELDTLYKNSVEISFATDDIKNDLLKLI